jgi:hypothetical protein
VREADGGGGGVEVAVDEVGVARVGRIDDGDVAVALDIAHHAGVQLLDRAALGVLGLVGGLAERTLGAALPTHQHR